nr:MAG TPA: hypothetical protein [Caudoviricetes sp.]
MRSQDQEFNGASSVTAGTIRHLRLAIEMT